MCLCKLLVHFEIYMDFFFHPFFFVADVYARDQHMPKYCTVVRLHFAHSHSLDTADVLRKRGLNPDIRQRFLEMYQHGTKPKDALDTHKVCFT